MRSPPWFLRTDEPKQKALVLDPATRTKAYVLVFVVVMLGLGAIASILHPTRTPTRTQSFLAQK